MVTKTPLIKGEDCPIIVLEKGDKQALYDTQTEKRLTRFEKDSFLIYNSSSEAEWHRKTNGKVLAVNGRNKSYLFIDYELVDSIENAEYNFFTMPPNSKYICIQRRGTRDGMREAIYDIRNKEYLTPFYRSIYPSEKFPRIKLYKAVTEKGEAIYSFPDNERLTAYYYSVMPIDKGILGGINDYYFVKNAQGAIFYFKAWNQPLLHGEHEFITYQIFRELEDKIDEHIIIERLFQTRKKM